MNLYKLFLLLALGLGTTQANALSVFACEPEWQALAAELAGEHAAIHTATSAHQDPHHVQARPSLISAVRRADLVICTGAGLETGWLPVLLAKGSNPRVLQPPGLFLAADQVALLDRPTTLDRADGDLHAEGNPHIHLDPRRLLKIADALHQRLIALDPENAEVYRARYASFAERWQSAMARWAQQAAALADTPVIVHHRSWHYLLDWLGMRQVGELEPRPGLPPTPGHLATLVKVAKADNARLVLYTDHNGSKAADWLASRTPACALALPFTVGGAPGADTLIGLFDTLVSKLLSGQECDHA